MMYLQNLINVYLTKYPWTPVYGVARTLMAFGTLLTLLFNDAGILFDFPNIQSTHQYGLPGNLFRSINIFYIFSQSIWVAKLISLLILCTVISGWRPAITGLLHFWVSFSFSSSSSLIDGGDSITTILTFMLLPLCFTDKRKTHWSYSNEDQNSYVKLFAWSVYLIIRIQVAFIYFHAGVEKMYIEEWANGTAVYYWFTNSIHGSASWLTPILTKLLSIPWILVTLTWGTIVFEILLSMALFIKRDQTNWKIIFISGIIFHLGIIIVFGLISFFFAMSACLVLYLVPLEYKQNRKAFSN